MSRTYGMGFEDKIMVTAVRKPALQSVGIERLRDILMNDDYLEINLSTKFQLEIVQKVNECFLHHDPIL